MRNNSIVLLCACLACLPVTGTAAIGTPLALTELVAKSDLVVKGTVTRVTRIGPDWIETANGPVMATLMSGEIQVERLLKGTVQLDSIQFQFKVPDVFMGYRSIGEKSHRVIFLKGDAQPYQLTDPHWPSVVAVPGSPIMSDEPLDRVVDAVAAVFGSASATRNQHREAIDVLRTAKMPAALAALRSALGTSDRVIQLHAAAALLARNDLAALPLAEAALLRPDPELPSDVLLNLRGAISAGLSSEAAVPALGRLLGARDAHTRGSAVQALGRTQSAAAVAHLVRALDDADFDVRLAAVRAFVDLSGRTDLAVSADSFRADEMHVVKYWKEWGAQK